MADTIDREIAEALGGVLRVPTLNWDHPYWEFPDGTAVDAEEFALVTTSIDAQQRHIDERLVPFEEFIEREGDGWKCQIQQVEGNPYPSAEIGHGPTKAHARAAALLEALRGVRE